jgi:cell division septation protein DedD
LIVSILGARDQWGDTKRLLEYGFDNYETLKMTPQPGGKSAVNEQQVSIRSERVSALTGKPSENSQARISQGYLLQIGSFRERDRAESLSRQMAEKGYEVFVEQIMLNRNEFAYRVRVGPYAEFLSAQEAAQEIFSKSGHRAMILPLQSDRQERGDAS